MFRFFPCVLLILSVVMLFGADNCPSEDEDGDGWTVNDGDCDDLDPTTYPGAPEYCDGIDHDCRGDLWERTERYESEDDYSVLDNPNGVWRYAWSEQAAPGNGEFPYVAPTTYPYSGMWQDFAIWYQEKGVQGYIGTNPSSDDIYLSSGAVITIPPGAIVSYPFGYYSTQVVWMAPQAGTCDIQAVFEKMETALSDAPVQVFHNQQELFRELEWESATIPAVTYNTRAPLAVHAGDTIAQVVHSPGPYLSVALHTTLGIVCSYSCD